MSLTPRPAVQVADIGHCALPPKLHKLWVTRLQEEFFAQVCAAIPVETRRYHVRDWHEVRHATRSVMFALSGSWRAGRPRATFWSANLPIDG